MQEKLAPSGGPGEHAKTTSTNRARKMAFVNSNLSSREVFPALNVKVSHVN